MNLEDYLQFLGISKASFARKIGLSENIIYNAFKGIDGVTLYTGLLIEKATNGDVTAKELLTEAQRKKIENVKSPFKKLGRIKKREESDRENTESDTKTNER